MDGGDDGLPGRRGGVEEVLAGVKCISALLVCEGRGAALLCCVWGDGMMSTLFTLISESHEHKEVVGSCEQV
jgi:hypothetical protein